MPLTLQALQDSVTDKSERISSLCRNLCDVQHQLFKAEDKKGDLEYQLVIKDEAMTALQADYKKLMDAKQAADTKVITSDKEVMDMVSTHSFT